MAATRYRPAFDVVRMHLSVLDYVPIATGRPMSASVTQCRRLARAVEALGYHRFWITEHHNAAAFASSATSVLIGYVAEGTSRLRVGAGGMMMLNHAPLHVAEQFGTLAMLYPGRIDLGIGAASGADPRAAELLRHAQAPSDMVDYLAQLQSYLAPASAAQLVRAVPGAGVEVPLWLLGSSEQSGALAGRLGLRFAFAGHLRRGANLAIAAYRAAFHPCEALALPFAALSVNVVAAQSNAAAEVIASSWLRRILDTQRGRPAPLREPDPALLAGCSDEERAAIERARGLSVIGGVSRVRCFLQDTIGECAPDELLVCTEVHGIADRLRSYQIVAEAFGER